MFNRLALPSALVGALTLAACATTPPPPSRPIRPLPRPQQPKPQPPKPAEPAVPLMRLSPASFAELPDWRGVDPGPAREAFRRQCALWAGRDPQTPLSNSPLAYGGRIADWTPACTLAQQDVAARDFFEQAFQPWRVGAEGGEAKLTAYYAPAIEARRAVEPGFTEPLLPRPADLLTIDTPAFAAALDSETLRKVSLLKGRVVGDRVVPYPSRAEITGRPEAAQAAIAWAHPADVYNLQVQGSGKLTFAAGDTACVGFADQNGFRWRSALGPVTKRTDWARGPDGTWASLKQYWDRHPEAVRADLNTDPSYVFFVERPGGSSCAVGSSGVLLVGGGSMAVDPRYHPYGAPIFAAGAAPGFPRLLVAQDTGGAIKRGPLRGDVFLGEGREAGAAAERVEVAGPAFFVLLPKGMTPPAASATQ
jgi:membrane-bound lytic murein transglycosylase A